VRTVPQETFAELTEKEMSATDELHVTFTGITKMRGVFQRLPVEKGSRPERKEKKL